MAGEGGVRMSREEGQVMQRNGGALDDGDGTVEREGGAELDARRGPS